MVGKLVVVFGGSGFVGRNVVRELAKRGWRVRVAVRRPHHALFLRPMGAVGQVQLFQANLRDRLSVAEALKGADAVVNCVGILHQEGSQSFEAVQVAGAAAIAELARDERVSKLVHISAIGASPGSESLYARSKAEGEAAVRAAVPTATILRPSIVFGPEDAFFNRFAAMALVSPALPLIGGGATRFQPVYVDDVADAVAAALERADALGRTYELGGPRVYTFRALMEFLLATIARKRLLLPLSFPVASFAGLAGEAAGFLPFAKPPLTRDQVRLLKQDNVVGEGAPTLADLGVTAKSVESIAPTYLYRFRKYGQFAERAPV